MLHSVFCSIAVKSAIYRDRTLTTTTFSPQLYAPAASKQFGIHIRTSAHSRALLRCCISSFPLTLPFPSHVSFSLHRYKLPPFSAEPLSILLALAPRLLNTGIQATPPGYLCPTNGIHASRNLLPAHGNAPRHVSILLARFFSAAALFVLVLASVLAGRGGGASCCGAGVGFGFTRFALGFAGGFFVFGGLRGEKMLAVWK